MKRLIALCVVALFAMSANAAATPVEPTSVIVKSSKTGTAKVTWGVSVSPPPLSGFWLEAWTARRANWWEGHWSSAFGVPPLIHEYEFTGLEANTAYKVWVGSEIQKNSEGFTPQTIQSQNHTFNSESYPDTVKAKATNPQGFQITGSVSVCKKATFEGKSTEGDETLEVHPKYEECEVELAGTFKAKVNTEGCNYLFHSAAPGTTGGSTDVVCETGKEVKVEVQGIEGGCQIKVPAQTGLKTVEYVNEGSGSARKDKVNANVTGIKWTATGACGLKESAGSNGEYREGKFNGLGIPELGSGPAVALTEGFTATEAPNGVWVE